MASQTQSPSPQSHLRGFIAGGMATCGAVTFTNPWEVVKIRMQLEGELRRSTRGHQPPRLYRGTLAGLGLIARHEGIRGVQKGLCAAYLYQIAMNGTRIGAYEPIKEGYFRLAGISSPDQPGSFPLRVLAGASAGVVGALVGSPLFLIKTRLQAYSPTLPVGVQHHYHGVIDALTQVVKSRGWLGLYQGATAAMIRTAMGSSVQLSTYDETKRLLSHHAAHWLGSEEGGENIRLHAVASLITGTFVCVAMNPMDVVSTRLYNQDPTGKGHRYSGPVDCVVKTLRTEGPRGLYKGFLAHYLRIGPHTVLTFVFLEQARLFLSRAWPA
ncbi:MAG: mitochondrial carrier domain-containing protein [Piptocephalis tieghemiana]|nr:MAG: mitochondrial carrier domain-containing protein [Piptocephalis tieghemiana]